jgi:probable F420-dependent oxidoreductase
MISRPFRFTVAMPPLGPEWRDKLRRIEDLGFSSVSISDHLTGGWQMDPIVTMTVAAEATTRLRVLAMVFCNDFRHTFLLHRSMANLDVFSGGRVEVGLGAGWKEADYRVLGIPFDPPARRIERLAESIEVMKDLFATGVPTPVQKPRPPLLVGGGGRRILELAGRAADIVGFNPRLPAEQVTPVRLRQKLGWVRAAASAAGRQPEELELQQSIVDMRLSHRGTTHRWTSSLAQVIPPEALAASPMALHGDLSACVDTLIQRREEYGVSYLHLGSNLEAAALIVERLAGR